MDILVWQDELHFILLVENYQLNKKWFIKNSSSKLVPKQPSDFSKIGFYSLAKGWSSQNPHERTISSSVCIENRNELTSPVLIQTIYNVDNILIWLSPVFRKLEIQKPRFANLINRDNYSLQARMASYSASVPHGCIHQAPCWCLE